MASRWWAFVRFFFRLLYNELAWMYDAVAWVVSLGQWQAWGRTAISHLQGEWVLELAHGPGHLLVTMAERGLSPVGLDLSSAMGRLARRRLQRVGQTVPILQARAQTLPFRNECFDSVVTTFPTLFILDRDTLYDVVRVLRPGGRLVVVAWAGLGGCDPLSRFIGWLYRVTGQGEPQSGVGETALTAVGLVPYVVREQVGRSVVILFIGARASRDDRTAWTADR
ncbi:MAG TPA: methyltransferase domain-containing protein [Chloroflexi bacterium]|nr:methyltransferase domain-containing protein [Chloroflexota bacterium]